MEWNSHAPGVEWNSHAPGVEWNSHAPGVKNIFATPTTKTTEFKVKSRCKSAAEAKAEHLLLITNQICLFAKS